MPRVRTLRAGWLWQLLAFVSFGALACLLMFPFRTPVKPLLILVAPVLAVILPLILRTAVRHAVRLKASFRWWHWLWLLLFLSGLTYRIRDISAIYQEPLDPWAILRVALVAVTAFVLGARLVPMRTRWVASLFSGVLGVLAAFALLNVASTLWSAFKLWTLYRSFEYFIDIALLAAILVAVWSTETYKTLFDWTWALYGLLLLSAWLGAIIDPAEALEHGTLLGVLGFRIVGVWPAVSADSMGEFSAVLALVASARLLSRRGSRHDTLWYSVLFAFSFVTMVCAQARSALAGFALGAVLVLLLSDRKVLSALVAFAGTMVLSILAVSGLLWAYILRSQTKGEFAGATGRLDWWKFGWKVYLQRPWTGWGAYAAARFVVMARLGENISSMHSDYVEILVGIGFLGVILAGVALLGTWRWLLRALRDPSLEPFERALAIEAVGVLGVISVRSVAATNLFSHAPVIFLLVLGYTELLRRRREYETAHPPEPMLAATR